MEKYKKNKQLNVQVKEQIVKDLLKGNFSNGKKLPSFQRIAQQYDVSVMTVTLAMNKLKKEGIIYTLPGRGTYLKKEIKQIEKIYLSRKNPLTFGLTFLDAYNLSSPYLSEVVKGISEKSHQLNINLQIFSTPSIEITPQENPLLWENLRKEKIDGLILASRIPVKDIVLLQEEKVPFVWINNKIPGEKIYCVLSDAFQTALLILEYIRLLGYKKISLIVPGDDPLFIDYIKNLGKEKGFLLKKNLIKTDSGDEKEVGYQATKEILPYNPEVIIGSGIEAIYGIISALKEEKISFPEDIALIGIGGGESNFLSSHNITSVEIPLKEMAYKSVEILYKILSKEETEKEIALPTKLYIRGSCGFPMKNKREIEINNLEELRKIFQSI